MARPSDYSQQSADIICELIADGLSLRTICKDNEDLPAMSTVFRWLTVHKEFQEQYAHAREEQAETLADEIIEIADDSTHDTTTHPESGYECANTEWITRSRLRVDARKWVASKLKPKKYGDKLQTELSGEINVGFHELLVKARERAGS